MEQHIGFEDDGIIYFHILIEVLPNFEDSLMNCNQYLQKNNKGAIGESFGFKEFEEKDKRMIIKNTDSISKNNNDNSNKILTRDEKIDTCSSWNMKILSPNLLIQDHEEFTLSPLNDSINYHQTLSNSVKSSPQQYEKQNDKCNLNVESSERLLNIPYPSDFQEEYQQQQQQQQLSDNIAIADNNNNNNIPTEHVENDLYVISPSFNNPETQQQQQQQQQDNNNNMNDSLYISDDSNITLLSSPSDPLLLESSPQSFHSNSRNMNKSNSFPLYNNNNNNNNSPPLLPLSNNNLPIPFNENNDLFINNSIIGDDNTNMNSWNNDWCNNQQYYTPLLSQEFDYNLFSNNNSSVNSTNNNYNSNNYSEPILLHSRKRNSIQENIIQQQQQQQQHEYTASDMTLMKRPKVPMSNRVCHECGTTVTPKWRRSPPPHRYILCNACGLQYTKDIEKGYYPSAINQMNNSNLCQGRECVNARKNGIKLYRRLFNRKLKLCYYCNKERMIKSNSSSSCSSFSRHSNDSTDTDSNSAYI